MLTLHSLLDILLLILVRESDSVFRVWLLTAFKPVTICFPFLPHILSGRQHTLSFGDEGRFRPHALVCPYLDPPLNPNKGQEQSKTCSLKPFLIPFASMPALPRKPHYVNNKSFHTFLVYMWHHGSTFDWILGEKSIPSQQGVWQQQFLQQAAFLSNDHNHWGVFSCSGFLICPAASWWVHTLSCCLLASMLLKLCWQAYTLSYCLVLHLLSPVESLLQI